MTDLEALLVMLAGLITATRLLGALLRAATVAVREATALMDAIAGARRTYRQLSGRHRQRRHSS